MIGFETIPLQRLKKTQGVATSYPLYGVLLIKLPNISEKLIKIGVLPLNILDLALIGSCGSNYKEKQ